MSCSVLKPNSLVCGKVIPLICSSTQKSRSQTLTEKNKGFIDLFTNNAYKQLYLPTISINKLKVYEDITFPKTIMDPVINNIEIIDAPLPGKPERKEAHRMILIRRRKMRKHKLRKFRKRYKNVLEKIKTRRELRKEQAFRAELLNQIIAAEKYDAKQYVDNILHTIRYQPRLETDQEIKARYREIMKMNKYKTMFIRPKFDD